MKRFLKQFFVGLTSVVIAILMPVSTYAITEEELYFYSQNNIFFASESVGACNIMLGSFDGESSAGLSDLQAAFVDTYHDIAENLSVMYGIPWETVISQGVLESASGTSRFAKERNNFFGIGAFDSNPNNAYSYDTPEDGWKGYYENIRKTRTYRNHGVFSGDTITDPYAYARAIKAAGYATDPNYVAKLDELIAAVENRSVERNWASSAELAIKYPVMLENAAENAAGAEMSGETPAISSTCAMFGNGDINDTAISLSWPDRTHLPTDPNPAYYAALNAQNGVAKLGQGDACTMGGYSCDAFLATVMRTSGMDPDFPCCTALKQLTYLSNSDLYEEIPNIDNTSNLQPGDIRASDSHVEIVVQLDDGAFKIASASHCDRTADHYSNYYSDSSFRVFRRK